MLPCEARASGERRLRRGRRGESAKRSIRLARLLLAIAGLPGLACSSLPDPGDFRVGASREEVLASFGTPSSQQSFRKTGDAIWGPIEDFWSRVPRESTVEVWSYRVEGGTVELYFVDGSEQVQGTGFAPRGAVYEPIGGGSPPARRDEALPPAGGAAR